MALWAPTGDHEQLRPKAEEYTLTVASGRGYDLDLSLFERLQRQGFPVASLVLQRRMQPDISALIRASIYPHLQVTYSLSAAAAWIQVLPAVCYVLSSADN